MKRIIAITITMLFLAQAFIGIQFVVKRMVEEESSVDIIPTGTDATVSRPRTRGAANESGPLGGSWFDDFANESGIEWKDNITLIERAVNSTNGTLTTTEIVLPNNMFWDTLSIAKNQPASTFINVSVINSTSNETIPGYDNLTARNKDISNINVSSIRLRAWFEGNGSATPTLGSWGVEWTKENAWRDSYIGDDKSNFSNATMGIYVNGSTQLAYNELVAGSNTTAMLNFNEGYGTVVNDSSGNGNDGVIHGANWTEGVDEQGLRFDGDDHVEIPDNPTLDITDKITIEAWILPEVSNEIDPGIVYHYDGNGWYLLLREGNTSNPKPAFSGKNINEAKSSVGLTIGKWNYIAITYDRQKVRIFLNGILTNDTIETDALTQSSSPLTIGRVSHANNAFFTGKIDNVAVYDRALTPSEIFNHSQRYHKIASLLSEPISLPQYHSWDTLVINKTEPANHYINVSIIDNATNQTIPGFSNLNASGIINISSIDPRNHTSIRLNATFEGNGSDTPLLHSWAVNWTNKRPVLGEPMGARPVNRTESVNISFRASDYEEYTPNLQFTAQFKLNSELEWNNADANDIDWNTTHFFFNLTPPVDAELGSYDIRIRLNDSLNASTGWKEYLSSFNVKNNIPVYDALSISGNEVTRSYNVTMTLLNVSDVEMDFNNLSISFYHRLNGTMNWSDDFIYSVMNRYDNETVEFVPGTSSTLGYYDILVSINDNDTFTNTTYPNLIHVKNNLPTLEDLYMESQEALRSGECTLVLDKLEDVEKESMDLQLSMYIRENGTSTWDVFETIYDDEFAGKLMYSCVFDADALLGPRDIRINISDGDDNISFVYGNVVTVTNNLPSISANFTNLSLREDTRNFSLIGLGTDVEDDEMDLTWAWNISTVNSTLIDNIALDGRNLTITPAAGANGTNKVEFILTDTDGDSTSKLVDIKVTPIPIELSAILFSPLHEAVINTSSVILEWKLKAVDTVAVVTYDIYFGEDIGGVINHNALYLINSTTSKSLSVDGLENGTKYFWTVIPRNATATGISDPLYYWFKVEISPPDDNNTAPTVELLSPTNGAEFDITSVEFHWKGNDKENDSMTYSIYISKNRTNVSSLSVSAIKGNTIFSVYSSVLEINTLYYWTVIPNDGKIDGICISGIWSFTTGDIPPPSATITAHSTRILAGEEVTFTIHYNETRSNGTEFLVNFFDGSASPWIKGGTVTHVYEKAGQYPVSLSARIDGVVIPIPGGVTITVIDPKTLGLEFIQLPYAGDDPTPILGNITGVNWISDNLTLRAEVNGNSIDITPGISWSDEIPSKYLKEGINNITVKLFFKGTLIDSEERNIPVPEKTDGNGGKGGISPGMWIGLIVIILVVICVLFLLTRKKKKEEEIEDSIVTKMPEYKCPECGESAERESVSCDQCGAEFDEPVLVGEEVPPEEIPVEEEPETEEDIPEIPTEKTPVPMDIHPADESHTCKICFGVIKTGLPVLTCNCGQHFHEECIKRVGECPACKAVPDLGISETGMPEMAPPEMLDEEMAEPSSPDIPPEIPPQAPPMDLPPEMPPAVPEPITTPPEVPVPEEPQTAAEAPAPSTGEPPAPPTVVSANSPPLDDRPVPASMVVLDQSVQCRICFGVVKTGLEVIQCSCGKIYHASCGIRVGECPSCSYDYKEFIDQVDEEVLIESVKDSIESGTREIDVKVEKLTTDNLLMQLKKQLVNREISIDEFYEKKKALIE